MLYPVVHKITIGRYTADHVSCSFKSTPLPIQSFHTNTNFVHGSPAWDDRITGQRGNRLWHKTWHHVNYRWLTKMKSTGTSAEVTGHCRGCVCSTTYH